jgi:hypothetical protein
MAKLELTTQEADNLVEILSSFNRYMQDVDYVPGARSWTDKSRFILHKLIDAMTPPTKNNSE